MPDFFRKVLGEKRMKVYIIINCYKQGREAVQQVFTDHIKAVEYLKKWKALGLRGLEAYAVEVMGRK